MSYLNIAQLLPCERTADVCQDLFGHRPSAGNVVRAVVRGAEKITPAVERIAGVLPDYRVNHITDFWGSSDTLELCDHSRCNVHLLRELTSFSEDGHRWVEGLIAALLAMKQAADDARQRGQKHTTPATLKPLLADYDRWICKGLETHPEVAKPAGKRGRAKQSKECNLLMRMSKKRVEVLRFAYDLDVPFHNNQAERAPTHDQGAAESIGIIPQRARSSDVLCEPQLPLHHPQTRP